MKISNLYKIYILVITMSLMVLAWACGNNNGNKYDTGQPQEQNSENQTQMQNQTNNSENTELTDWQVKHGIGPVTEDLKLGKIDKDMAMKGKDIFNSKCTACHKLDEKLIGPAQRDVIERRSPEYIMNMILNPQGMLDKNPEAQKMLAQYKTPMTNQNLTREEARQVLEYFRYVDKEK